MNSLYVIAFVFICLSLWWSTTHIPPWSATTTPPKPPPTPQQFVNVTGGVHNPQRMPWNADLTVMAAIAQCGGFKGGGDIYVTRGFQRIRMTQEELRRDPSKNIKLLAGDGIGSFYGV